MKKDKHIEKSIQWAKKKGFSKFRADLDGFDDPINFTRSSDQAEFAPDLTAVSRNNRKHYFHVTLKKEETEDTLSQIKLYHKLAKAKDGKLYLMAPMGNLRYARDISKKLEMAEVIRI
ncbi:hypothetical protein [Jiulongibacter sediminis]|uniref:Uncharacterized protein n=1 Tax=Jiulongibacter sediminis TaxID=1605367 RepID=A0A0P7BRQ1_9BACT|nr:hypothetical protein [Jiulongibacter sediminis]KPM47030.1 hypothetical protein AFM12_17540 [Jiulongibacter sediminis]TBX22372.1 hypothetical protein TK44_17545 [Jiulongibacter sediminis]